METDLLVRLSLTPNFDRLGAVTGLSILYTVNSPEARAGETLLIFEEVDEGGRPNYHYEEHDVVAFDNAGPFHLHFVPLDGRPGLRAWIVSRDTVEDVHIQLEVKPRALAGRSDGRPIPVTPLCISTGTQPLRSDQKGLIGSGQWFLPLVHCNKYRHRRCTHLVGWDLEAGPQNTRAVCSFGEGPEPVTKIGDTSTFRQMAIMVGPVNSWPRRDAPSPQPPSSTASRCQAFWLGELPSNITHMTEYLNNVFDSVADFFGDQTGTHRLFIQKADRGFQIIEHSLTSSSFLQYDDQSAMLSDFELVRSTHCQLVHSWLHVQAVHGQGGYLWFNNGFALLYTVFFPFRFKQRGPDYFLATLNMFLSSYYTNPLLRSSWHEASSVSAATGWYYHAQQCMRGFVYAMKMDSYSRRASRETEAGVARPIDNIVSQLSERYRLGESVTVSDFLAELSRWLGNEATWQHFHSMLSGKVLDLADLQSSFGERHEPTAVEQELLEFGFDFPGDACSGMIEVPFTVSGLIAGSRAQQAGLENGDTVIDCDGLAACLTDFQGNVKLVVERRGLFLEIDYWPRSWAKTTSWQILEKASSSYD